LKSTLFVLSIIVIVSACSKKTSPSATRTATYREKVISTGTMSADIINYVNAYRQRKGLAPMRLLSLAASLASGHSLNMAAKKVSFGHTGFNQRAIAIANELHGTSSTGENVAYGKMTAKEVLDAWLKSPVHRANIEGPFNYTGVGVAKNSRGVVYYTQIFVKK
jgi:uncharacterized protein YkwD